MKTYKYISIVVTSNDGRKFNNDLKLSEVNIITQLLKENRSITAEITECSDKHYLAMFGHKFILNNACIYVYMYIYLQQI